VFFAVARETRGVVRLVDKTPQNTPYARHLLLAFPQARLLYLARHPVDVYSSYRRRSALDAGADWTRLPVDEFIRRYRFMAETALRFVEQHPEAIALVRYEDLTTDLEATFERICRFVGECPDREALLRDTSDEGGVAFDPHLFSAVVAKTKEWSDYVSPQEAAEIERQLAPIVAEFGYEPYVAARPASAGGVG